MISEEAKKSVIANTNGTALINGGKNLFDFRPRKISRAPVLTESARRNNIACQVGCDVIMKMQVLKERAHHRGHGRKARAFHEFGFVHEECINVKNGDVFEMTQTPTRQEPSKPQEISEAVLESDFFETPMNAAEFEIAVHQRNRNQPALGNGLGFAELLIHLAEGEGHKGVNGTSQMPNIIFAEAPLINAPAIHSSAPNVVVDDARCDFRDGTEMATDDVAVKIIDREIQAVQSSFGVPMTQEMLQVLFPVWSKQWELIAQDIRRPNEKLTKSALVAGETTRHMQPTTRDSLGGIVEDKTAVDGVTAERSQRVENGFESLGPVRIFFSIAKVLLHNLRREFGERQSPTGQPLKKDAQVIPKVRARAFAFPLAFNVLRKTPNEISIHHGTNTISANLQTPLRGLWWRSNTERVKGNDVDEFMAA
ncbi:MAG: hypothetical protein KCHDKBKB_02397 [Elusimicrobia bacterium]|nr:hypothetical protein [Elusimicrobiota bacterium]